MPARRGARSGGHEAVVQRVVETVRGDLRLDERSALIGKAAAKTGRSTSAGAAAKVVRAHLHRLEALPARSARHQKDRELPEKAVRLHLPAQNLQ